MSNTKINPFRPIVPMIYGYITPGVPKHDHWTKIGYTDSQSVEDRIDQQTHTADIDYTITLEDNAIYKDSSGESFTDHDFHRFLTDKADIERKKNTEWFKIEQPQLGELFNKFARRDYSDVQTKGTNHSSYTLRKEQDQAVTMTEKYFKSHGKGAEFLWNAKPRFGKTLSTYDLVRRMNLTNVLVVTNRPSIANSWFDDFKKFIGWQTNYKFVSDNDALKNKDTLSRKEFIKLLDYGDYKQIAFESLQGLKGSVYFGGDIDKLEWIKDLHWDLLVVDEAHEGVDTYKTDKAFDKIDRKYTLYLTGTPFKALAEGKFAEEQIFNWSYADEQRSKENWDVTNESSSNPYAVMPRLNMYTYQMSQIMTERAEQKVDLSNGDQVDPAFDLNEFFRVKSNGEFVYDEDVDRFLDTLTTNEKYPFSTPLLRQDLAHTFWILNRVNSAKALAKKLKDHPVFGKYDIIVAAGDGKLDDDQLNEDQLNQANEKSYDRVIKAISDVENGKSKYIGTITLSVGQLTTGVTIKPWTGVLMLSNMKSPAQYMQAAFRAQNPYKVRRGKDIYQKENSYVFDFDPARTLTIFDDFANNLKQTTAGGKGTADEHEENIRELLNFFPVIGEDQDGKMVELDAKQIMSIPRHLKSNEVVRHGFISNFLFTNIGHIFNAPAEVRSILNNLIKAKEDKGRKPIKSIDDADDVPTDNEGNINISDEMVIGKSKDLFGDKVYGDVSSDMDEALSSKFDDAEPEDTDEGITDAQKLVKDVAKQMDNSLQVHVWDKISDEYKLNKTQTKHFQEKLSKENATQLSHIADNYHDQAKVAKTKFQEQQKAAKNDKELKQAQDDYKDQMNSLLDDFKTQVTDHVQKTIQNTPNEAIKQVEQHKAEQEKHSIEDDARAHLRGFSRTIPSFLMAYNNRDINLQNFDSCVEADVFKEVTGITVDQFRFLRDGGDYIDQETGETKHFEGHLFDEVVFNDSIQNFFDLKDNLSDYFDEDAKEDIFDYIPPQKTNQIYTPKAIVKKMVDDLEKENPNIFDDPNKTFADLYMKSGLYITEIVKRLYANPVIKQFYPDDHERIIHILNHQVYGLAPTRIIYLIATNYILGFNDDIKKDIKGDHFKQADAAEASKKGKLQELVDKEFGTD